MVATLGAGAVVPAGDAGALAAALTRVLTNNLLAAEWGETSRRGAAAHYAPHVVTEQVREVHHRVVGRVSERAAS